MSTHKAIVKYGRQWFYPGRQITDLDVEIQAWAQGLDVANGGLGKTAHYRNAVSAIWPDYDWHDYTVAMAQAFNQHKVVGIAGAGGTGKSDGLAVWLLMNWFADPLNTLILVTTTSKSDAERRIWGHIARRYKQAQLRGVRIGKIVEHAHIIKFANTDRIPVGSQSSITLVAAGDEYKDEALKKLQGAHAKKVMLGLDELQDLTPNILNEAAENLKRNPEFFLYGLCNPADQLGPDGQFMQPVDGWNSVSVETRAWRITPAGLSGIALHFDEEDSPNIKSFQLTGKNAYPYLPKYEEVMYAKQNADRSNPMYWRQNRGWWPPGNIDDSYVLNSALITTHKGTERLIGEQWWASTPVKIAGIDPAYTSGGDRFPMFPCEWGQRADDGIWTLHYLEPIYLRKPETKGDEEFHYAMLQEIMKQAGEMGIEPSNIGVDATAGGLFWAMGQRFESGYGTLRGWIGVDFGGAASDMPVTYQENLLKPSKDGKQVPRTAREMFKNKVSELWFVFRHFLECDQIRGMQADQVWEMCRRKWTVTTGNKIMVESKDDMKSRIRRSPDTADAGNIALHVVREKFGAVAGGAAKEQHQRERRAAWKKFVQKTDPTQLCVGWAKNN